MTSHPKFWNDRSPRFWWGFWILILFFLFWAWSCYFRFEAAHQSPTGRRLEFMIGRGGLILGSWQYATSLPLMFRGWEFQFGSVIAFDGWPRFSRSDVSMGIYQRLFIPLWIPLLTWLVLWRLWLRHAHKKAGANFSHPAEMENR